MSKIDVIFDMETGDPDDLMTLFLLLGHPRVNLKAVAVTPGSIYQIGLVRWALEQFEVDIPVGAFNIKHPKKSVSGWYYKNFGDIPPSDDAVYGPDIYAACVDPDTVIITGGPLKNLGECLRNTLIYPKKIVVQGGFAGVNLVANPLEKFAGMKTCPTYNLNGDPKRGMEVISYQHCQKYFVSKNVCHGVYYNRELHEKVVEIKDESLAMGFIYKAMDAYLKKHPDGKKFHDPLAACCAINPEIGVWSNPVELYREKGKWGAREHSGMKNYIILDYNRDKFMETLLEI